jgi:hypothetical protein
VVGCQCQWEEESVEVCILSRELIHRERNEIDEVRKSRIKR